VEQLGGSFGTDRTCVIPLETTPLDPSSLRVMVDSVPLPEFADLSGARNWRFDPVQLAVVFEGQACTDMEIQVVHEIDVIADCP
jgi:hypothetical protein